MNHKFLSTQTLLVCSLSFLHADNPQHPANEHPYHQGYVADGAVSPSSRFEVKNGCNMFFTGDFLWWSANTDGLYYAQGNFGSPSVGIPTGKHTDFAGHLKRVKEEWSPGCRVGFGGNLPFDEWDAYLNWTWFHSDPKDSAKETSDGPLLVLWAHPDSEETRFASRAHGKWDLTLNIIDFELGRALWIGEHLSLHPFLGIRGAWIDQEFKVKYRYATSPSFEGEIEAESDFEGVGVRAGLDLRFSLLNGWSIYGLATGALMYGHLDCDSHQKANHHLIARTDDGFHRGVSTVQMGLGLQWDAYLGHDRFHVGVRMGWEQNIWYGVTQFNRYHTQLQTGDLVQNNGDLTLQGGTLSAQFDF